MARIGIQTWGSEGDVQPFLALAAALAERGHAIILSMATASDAVYEAPPGVEIRRVAGEMTKADGTALIEDVCQLSNPLEQAALVMERGFSPHFGALEAAAGELADECDLIVRHHFLFMAQAAAMRAGKPEVSVFLAPDLLPTKTRPPTGMPRLGPLNGLAWKVMAKMVGGVFLPPATELRARWRLPPPANLLHDVWSSETANLIATSPVLSPRPDDWPAHHHMTGFWPGPLGAGCPCPPELESYLEAGAMPVYVTFGSMTPTGEAKQRALVELLRDAAGRAGARLVVQLPGRAAELVDEAVLIVPAAPHAGVFPRCAAVVHHGGAGTTQTVLRAGCPSVVVPHLADQFFWGACVKRAGIGVVTGARAKVTAAHLAVALGQVLGSERHRSAAQTLGQSLDDGDALGRACEVVERSVGG